MRINNKTCTIILTNRESRTAGHHGNAPDPREADELGGVVRQAAHDQASRTGLRSEVYATQRGVAPWLVYSCEP